MWKIMSNGFLSQEEIDSLLNGGGASEEPVIEEVLSDIEKDLLGEIGNITMGSASTALSTIIGQQVNITTPEVSVTKLISLRNAFEVPNIALEVKYTSGIVGENLLVMQIKDAGVISNLMMGGDGKSNITELSELEESAVCEAMNQMIGSAATSMATMFSREVNISPPVSKIWSDVSSPISEGISENEDIVQISFKLKIGELVDSSIMQLLPISTAKKIVSIMMGQEEPEPTAPVTQQTYKEPVNNVIVEKPMENYSEVKARPAEPRVEVQRAAFQPLEQSATYSTPKNIDLILDVPLEISVVLGKTKKSIRDILNFGTGSLIELDKLAEEPVEILVNGKRVAYGEVVVVDENFGVRITSIVSSSDRLKSLGE
jgi:flagellar motor switch protein FliN/FliY